MKEILSKINCLEKVIMRKEIEIEIGVLNDLLNKYPELSAGDFDVKTPYGFKQIEWCGITEENAEVYKCELEDGKYVEGADYHRLKKEDGGWEVLKTIEVGTPIQTIDGISNVKSISLNDEKDTLYDIQVNEVHQYYSNGIVSHNTTFTVDAIMFLLFGKTSKTDKNIGIFNRHSDSDMVKVRGMIEYENKDLIIERKLTRKLKTDNTYTVTTKMAYYQILPDGEEKKLNAEETKSTTDEIRKIVGFESDFEIVVCATGDNLEDSVKGTPSQRGSLITRFIGLEPIMEKEKIVRSMYNEFSKKLKGNLYNVIELTDEVTIHKENVEMCDALLEKHLITQNKLNDESSELAIKRDSVLSRKVNINKNLSEVNPKLLNEEIEIISNKGVKLKENLKNFNIEIEKLVDVMFDEDKYHKISAEKFDLELEEKKILSDNAILKSEIENLKNAEFCVTCNSPLKDVDNSGKITEKEGLIKENVESHTMITNQINEKVGYIEKNKGNQEKVKIRNRLELDRDRVEIEIGRLRNEIKEKLNVKKEFDLNLESININKEIDVEISKIDTDIIVNRTNREKVINQLQLVRNDRDNNLNEVNKKGELIKDINNEEEVVRIFKVYIEMIGNKGISKLILRSVLPIINSELFRLMDDICDFTLEMDINTKNEVDYYILKDGIKSPIKSGSGLERTISALAVRVVLGRLTTLPTPNFIVFDEILGKIANENIETMKLLFDKITEMYDSIFFITHRDLVKEWSDNIITIEKDKNISSFS